MPADRDEGATQREGGGARRVREGRAAPIVRGSVPQRVRRRATGGRRLSPLFNVGIRPQPSAVRRDAAVSL